MKSIRLLQSSLVLGAVVAVAGFAACEGSIGGPQGGSAGTQGTGNQDQGSSSAVSGGNTSAGSGPASTSGSTGPSAITAGASGSLPPAATDTLTPESAGTLLMRRLTNTEYNNIMAHLLGDTTQPAALFPADAIALESGAPNSVADLNVQLYYQAAQTLVANAVKNATAAGNQLVVPSAGTTAAAQTSAATTFIQNFGLLAYRRPVAAAEQTDLLTVFSTAIGLNYSFGNAIGYVVQAMIQSPNFLYHWEIGPTEPTVDQASGLAPLTPWQVASRLSLMLWNDMPDSTLLTAAQQGQLSTPDQITAQATRMFADSRFSQALYDFHFQWLLEVAGNVTNLANTQHSSPLFTAAAAQAIGTEFSQFLSSVYSPTGDGTYKTLMTAPYTFINSDLAPIYGVTAQGTGFNKLQLDPTQRSGVLTQLAFLGSQADVTADNPVRRGLAVYENLLCGAVGSPPNFVPGLPATIPPGTTTRQRFALHASSTCALGCHGLFDPPGFAFENYDAIGAYRTTDNGSPVDATGSFVTPGGATMTFTNAVDLAGQLAQSSEAQWCADRSWLRYGMGRMETAAELGSLQLAYRKATGTPGFALRDMLSSLVASKAFTYRTPSLGEAL
jgi:hypothetical protein